MESSNMCCGIEWRSEKLSWKEEVAQLFSTEIMTIKPNELLSTAETSLKAEKRGLLRVQFG